MHFNIVVITSTLLASASLAVSATVTGFTGANCTTPQDHTYTVGPPICFAYGCASWRSIRYTGVPNNIELYVSGGPHDSCTNGPSLVLGGGFAMMGAKTKIEDSFLGTSMMHDAPEFLVSATQTEMDNG